MSFAFKLSNCTPQEQLFLGIQSEFISSAERVQVWINTFARTSESPDSAKRHLEIMLAKFAEIEGMYSKLNSHFLENEAYQSLQKRLEDVSGIIRPSPRQDILDYLKQTFIQKRDDFIRCELSIEYKGIPIDFRSFDVLAHEYNTSKQKEQVISQMKVVLENTRRKLLTLEKASYENLRDFQEVFRQKEQIAKRYELDAQLNKFETLKINYSKEPNKSVEQMRGCVAEMHRISATFSNSIDQKQGIGKCERFLNPREFRYRMEKIDALKKRYPHEIKKGLIIFEMRRHIEAMRQLPSISLEQSRQLKLQERQFEQYEAEMKQRETIEIKVQEYFAKFENSKNMFEGSFRQKGIAAAEMRHCINELYLNLEELEKIGGPEEKRFLDLKKQVEERKEETLFCELTLHIDKRFGIVEKQEWYKKFWFYVHELIEIPPSDLPSRLLEKYRRVIEEFILKKRKEVCVPTDKGLDGINVMAKLLKKCPIPVRGDGEYRKILDRLRLNFGEAIVFMQNPSVDPAFVALAYREIGKRSNPIITAHTIRWALIELKKFRGGEKKWSENFAIKQKKFFKNEIEKLRQKRKDNEESSDTSDEETKERGEISFDTMRSSRMKNLERDLEKQLEKESETNSSPLSSAPQTPTLLEARETFREDEETGYCVYEAMRDAIIRAAATLSINVTKEQLEDKLLIEMKQKRYQFGKFLVDVNNGKGNVNYIRALARKKLGCKPYQVTEEDMRSREEGKEEILKAIAHVLNIRILYQKTSSALMRIGSNKKKTIRLSCEREEADDNPKPKKLRRVEPPSQQAHLDDTQFHEITDPQERINQLLKPLLEEWSSLSYRVDMPALLDKLKPFDQNITELLFLLKQLREKYKQYEPLSNAEKQRTDINNLQDVLRDSIRRYEQKKLSSNAEEKGRNVYVLYHGSCEENDAIFSSPRLQVIPSDGLDFYNALIEGWQEIMQKQVYLKRLDCGVWGSNNCFFAALKPHGYVLQKLAQRLNISETSDGKDFRKALFEWMKNNLNIILNPDASLDYSVTLRSLTVRSLIEEMRGHPYVSKELRDLSIEDYLEKMGNSDEYIGEEAYAIVSYLTQVEILTFLPEADQCDASNGLGGAGSGRILKLQRAGILASTLNFRQKIHVFAGQGHNEALVD